MMQLKKHIKLLIVFFGSIGVVCLILHEAYIVNPSNPIASLRIFKYFTVQSNFVAISYFWFIHSSGVDEKNEKWRNFVGGVMIYTTITFLVFATILEPLWQETGLQLLGSIALHYINPLLVIAYVYINKERLNFKVRDSLLWIIYPILYLVFLTTWGILTGDFLYPFFQIETVGVFGFIIVILGLIVLFMLLSFLVVKILSKKSHVFSSFSKK